MLLLRPLGGVKSKLIVLQDHIEWVSKSSCWSCLQLLHQPGSFLVSSYWLWAIEFRALEVARWKKPSVAAWQLCHCKVMERARQSPNPIVSLQTQLGPYSAPFQSWGKPPWAGWLPGQAFAPSLLSEKCEGHKCVPFCHLSHQKYPLLLWNS